MGMNFQKLIYSFDPTTPAVAVDFETYYASDYSVAKSSYWAYTHDPRFDAYLVSIFADNLHYVGHPRDFDWTQIAHMLWLSHNRPFDEHVFMRLVELGVVPGVERHAWCDTADLARYMKFPASLGKAAPLMIDMKIDKGVRDEMKDQRFEDLDPEDRERWIQYADLDAVACYKIWEAYKDQWPRHEMLLSMHTAECVKRGVYVNEVAVDEALEVLPTAIQEIESRIPWAGEPLLTPTGKQRTKGGVPQTKSPTSSTWLGKLCKANGIPVPASTDTKDPRWQSWLDKYKDTEVAAVIDAMQEWRRVNRTLRIAEQVKSRIRDDGRMEFCLMYFGARNTGRWSGKHGDYEERPDSTNLNMLNLPKDHLKVGDHHIYIREWFCAPEGKHMIVCDLSQIEPRVLAAIVENEDFLDLLRTGMDPYEAHARTTMGYKDPRPLKDVDPDVRTQAKVRVLQLGYQSGAAKLKDTANALYGMDMSLSEAQKIVADFRSKEHGITAMWDDCQAQIKRCYNKARLRRKNLVEVLRKGPEEPDMTFVLNSGRTLDYFHLTRHDGNFMASTWRGGKAGKLYGGHVTENLTQAQARDVFAEGILRCEAKGIQVLWHVYDEVIVEADTSVPADLVRDLMSQPPSWDSKLPVAAEAESMQAYRK